MKTFETYWNDEEFRTFSPGDEADKKELKVALTRKEKDEDKEYVFFDLRPYSHQKEILEDLRVEREEYESYKNLVVASTGSGKTLTSFKAAILATEIPTIDKVIFVVDRKDLDYQTMKEYDRFEKGAANGNSSTRVLQRQLEN